VRWPPYWHLFLLRDAANHTAHSLGSIRSSASIMKGALVALAFSMAVATISAASIPTQRRRLGEPSLASFSLLALFELNPICAGLPCSTLADSSSGDLGDFGDFGFDNGDFFKKFATEKAAAEQQKEEVKQKAQNEQAKASEQAKAATAAEAAEKHKQDLKEKAKQYNKNFEANIDENETNAFKKVKAFHNKNTDAHIDYQENFAQTDKQKAEEAARFAHQAAFKAHEAAAEKAKAENAFKKG
jgi:hypothetical protein